MSKVFNQFGLKVLQLKGFKRKEFQHDGSPVYYLEGGNSNGPTLVVLPGYGDTVFSWTDLLLRYAKRYRILALDFPGYMGFSPTPRPGKPLEFDAIEQVAETFLVSTVGRADFLIGNSLGGWIGVRLAHKHPERIGQLITINPAGILTSEAEARAIRLQYDVKKYGDFLNLMKLMWHRVPYYLYPFSWLGYYQYTRRSEFGGMFDSIREEHFVNRLLPEIKIPVTVIWGTSDRLFGHDLGKLMASTSPGVRYVPIRDAGHMPHLEKRDEVYRILNELFAPAA